MRTYLILSRLSVEAFKDPAELPKVADIVARTIKERCPGVRWVSSYGALGRFDVVDIVESDSELEVEKAAMIIRGLGHSATETLVLTPWKDFLGNLKK